MSLEYLDDLFEMDEELREEKERMSALVESSKIMLYEKQRKIFNKGIKLIKKKKFQKALDIFNQIIEENPYTVDGLYNRAYVFNRLGVYQAAINDLNFVLENDYNYLNAYIERAAAYSSVENYYSAIDDLTELIKRDPGNIEAYYFRATSSMALRRYGRACVDLTIVIYANPNKPDLYLLRGQAYLARNIVDVAIADFSKALTLNSKLFNVQILRASTYEYSGDPMSSLKDYKKAVEIEPDSPYSHLELAKAFIRRRDHENALDEIEKALKLDTDVSAAWEAIPLLASIAEPDEIVEPIIDLAVGSKAEKVEIIRKEIAVINLVIAGMSMPLITLPLKSLDILEDYIRSMTMIDESATTGVFTYMLGDDKVDVELSWGKNADGHKTTSLELKYQSKSENKAKKAKETINHKKSQISLSSPINEGFSFID